MKFLLLATLLALPCAASERVFNLDDLADKINAGQTAKQYCEAKAAESVRQAKASGAPADALKPLAEWVAIACSLDVGQLGKG